MTRILRALNEQGGVGRTLISQPTCQRRKTQKVLSQRQKEEGHQVDFGAGDDATDACLYRIKKKQKTKTSLGSSVSSHFCAGAAFALQQHWKVTQCFPSIHLHVAACPNLSNQLHNIVTYIPHVTQGFFFFLNIFFVQFLENLNIKPLYMCRKGLTWYLFFKDL